MKVRKFYVNPVMEEFFVNQQLSLLIDMSAELPDGADEGDADTFGSITTTTP